MTPQGGGRARRTRFTHIQSCRTVPLTFENGRRCNDRHRLHVADRPLDLASCVGAQCRSEELLIVDDERTRRIVPQNTYSDRLSVRSFGLGAPRGAGCFRKRFIPFRTPGGFTLRVQSISIPGSQNVAGQHLAPRCDRSLPERRSTPQQPFRGFSTRLTVNRD